MIRHILSMLMLMPMLPVLAQESAEVQYPMKEMTVERLPDLNIARSGHQVFFVGGELVVAGGHTTNYEPTLTAERLRVGERSSGTQFADGEWQLMEMAYIHDDGFSTILPDGTVLLAGGHKEHMGIGQTFAAEKYDPKTHSFHGFASLDTKRALSSALSLGDGRVVISGCWYDKDAIEIFDGDHRFSLLKGVAQDRTRPFILQTAPDDAIIFGPIAADGKHLDTILVDRLHGDPFHVPLLNQWKPYSLLTHMASDACFTGDRQKGIYTHLLPVMNDNGQVAFCQVEAKQQADTTAISFSLLPTPCPIPMKTNIGGDITYVSFLVDRSAQHGYLVGNDADRRFYVLCLDYRQGNALTLYYSEPQIYISEFEPVLTPDGDIIIAGGHPKDNFSPLASVFRLHLGTRALAARHTLPLWLWILLGTLVLCLIVVGLWLVLRHKKPVSTHKIITIPAKPMREDHISDEQLMMRLCELMEQERPYLNSDLTQQDVASMLDVKSQRLSECLINQRNCLFPSFVNGYRVEYAMKLMNGSTKIRLKEVCFQSGFSSERSFFRNFKIINGMTPKEWLRNKV